MCVVETGMAGGGLICRASTPAGGWRGRAHRGWQKDGGLHGGLYYTKMIDNKGFLILLCKHMEWSGREFLLFPRKSMARRKNLLPYPTVEVVLRTRFNIWNSARRRGEGTALPVSVSVPAPASVTSPPPWPARPGLTAAWPPWLSPAAVPAFQSVRRLLDSSRSCPVAGWRSASLPGQACSSWRSRSNAGRHQIPAPLAWLPKPKVVGSTATGCKAWQRRGIVADSCREHYCDSRE
jgi:hypothetical protein